MAVMAKEIMREMRQFKYYIKNFGCKVNQYDGRLMEKNLSLVGGDMGRASSADVILVNTCGVTKTALKSCRKYIKQIKRKFPNKEILAVGCAAYKSKKTFLSAGASIAPHFKYLRGPGGQLPDFSFRTRAFLKIQQGCLGGCSYCVVRHLKTPFYVKPPLEVVAEMKKLAESHPEIVLCGTNLSYYALDKNIKNSQMHILLEKIKKMPAGFRWRFSSIPPRCLTSRNIDILSKDSKFCNHFHIPVQSGSPSILKKMKRPYTLKYLKERMGIIKEKFKNVAFSYDLIVGFPSETEEDLEKTIKFVKEYPPVRVHIFPYSKVSAEKISGNEVSEKIKRERMKKLNKETAAIIENRLSREIGKMREIIPEKNGFGYTREYIYVKAKNVHPSRQAIRVFLSGKSGGILTGEVRPNII